VVLPTVWNHFEGAFAVALRKEILVITETNVAADGITWSGGGQLILGAPRSAGRQRYLRNGYVYAAKGRDRVLVVREQRAKMPADIGGGIYISLKDRDDISSIENQIDGLHRQADLAVLHVPPNSILQGAHASKSDSVTSSMRKADCCFAAWKHLRPWSLRSRLSKQDGVYFRSRRRDVSAKIW
jgi:hypothetical protein